MRQMWQQVTEKQARVNIGECFGVWHCCLILNFQFHGSPTTKARDDHHHHPRPVHQQHVGNRSPLQWLRAAAVQSGRSGAAPWPQDLAIPHGKGKSLGCSSFRYEKSHYAVLEHAPYRTCQFFNGARYQCFCKECRSMSQCILWLGATLPNLKTRLYISKR